MRKMKADHEDDVRKIREQSEKYWRKENSMSGSNQKQHYSSQNLLEEGLYEIKKAYEAKADKLQQENEKLKK